MKIPYPDIYLGKKIRVHCMDGKVFTGDFYGYNFDYDDDGNEFAEIDIEITSSYGVGFTEMEIKRIEILGDANGIVFQELYDYINGIISHVLFEYKEKECGIDPLSHTEFDVWYGEKEETMSSVEAVFNTPFFDGKSLTEIFTEIAPTIDW